MKITNVSKQGQTIRLKFNGHLPNGEKFLDLHYVPHRDDIDAARVVNVVYEVLGELLQSAEKDWRYRWAKVNG